MTYAVIRRATIPALAVLTFTGSYLASIETADARRGFRMQFSSGRVAASAATAARGPARVTRSTEETARLRQVESRIDWGEAAKRGMEFVKIAMEQALSASGSPSGSSSAFAGSTLNPVELRACVSEAKWLDDASDAFDAKKARLDGAKTEIEQLSKEIDAARPRVNRSSQRSVDAFNARIEDHRRRVAHFNDVLLADVRRSQDSFNARVRAFNASCNGKSYYSSDLADVETKLGFKLAN